MLLLPKTCAIRPTRASRLHVRADKEQIFVDEQRQAAAIKTQINAGRSAATPVDAATRSRYRRAVAKRDLLAAESNAYMLGMVPPPVRKSAVAAVRQLRGSGAAPKLTRHAAALGGTWELVRPTAPLVFGPRDIEDLSLGGITWGETMVHVTDVSRRFDADTFSEAYTLRGTTDTIRRFGHFEVIDDKTLAVRLQSVSLTTGTATITVRPSGEDARFKLCYLDKNFCLVGSARERAETVQAWVREDSAPVRRFRKAR